MNADDADEMMSSVLGHTDKQRIFDMFKIRKSLTSLAVLSPKAERTVTAERAPQVDAGPTVLTRAVAAEVSFCRASLKQGERN